VILRFVHPYCPPNFAHQAEFHVSATLLLASFDVVLAVDPADHNGAMQCFGLL